MITTHVKSVYFLRSEKKNVVKVIDHLLLEAEPRSKHVFDQMSDQNPVENHLLPLSWEENLRSKIVYFLRN